MFLSYIQINFSDQKLIVFTRANLLKKLFFNVQATCSINTLGTAPSTFHRFPTPQSVVQRYLLQMWCTPVNAVDVAVTINTRRHG